MPIGLFGGSYVSEIDCEHLVKLAIMKAPTEFEKLVIKIAEESTNQEHNYIKSLRPNDYPSTVDAKNFQ